MLINDMIHTIDKIHVALYNEKSNHFHQLSKKHVKIFFKSDVITVDQIIPNRIRITFSEYVGKIGEYRNLFGRIMHNDDNVCDTSDFIDLTIPHAKKIIEVIHDTPIEKINSL